MAATARTRCEPSPTCGTARSGCGSRRGSSTGRSTTPTFRREASSPSTTGPGSPGVTTGWAPSRWPTGTSCSSATTRSTDRSPPPSAPEPRTTTTRAAARPPSRSPSTARSFASFTSLNGTQMNCSGGIMPWGSWVTCEETVNGPDVGPDFTGASNVTLEQAPRVHLRGAGGRPVEPRADHRGGAVRPRGGRLRSPRRECSTSPRTTSASRPASTVTCPRRTR